MRIALLATAAVAIALVACGDDSDETAGTDGCDLLASSDVRELVGSVPEKHTASASARDHLQSCAWQITADHAVLTLEARDADSTLFESQTRGFTDVSAGDIRARVSVNSQPSSGTRSGNLWALDKRKLVHIVLADSKLDEAALKSRLVTAARNALDRAGR